MSFHDVLGRARMQPVDFRDDLAPPNVVWVGGSWGPRRTGTESQG